MKFHFNKWQNTSRLSNIVIHFFDISVIPSKFIRRLLVKAAIHSSWRKNRKLLRNTFFLMR